VRYFADLAGMSRLLSFLMEDCCDGKPEACAPLLDMATRACGGRGDCPSQPSERGRK